MGWSLKLRLEAGSGLVCAAFHEKAFKFKDQNFNFGDSWRRLVLGEMNVESRFHSHS